ncbi:MAG TPA: hypothetical protein VFW79_06120 [Cellulomonas sp.]|uniref:hypothetical protein n=1 Tax=Cellulomonas sp. TaxID=40001 RepID=UPI002E2F3DC8|nr:hypothetical protein [Cellulomonas sp.]HEX5332201.1 hypothetical protein [Cellulomonas sp.]
MPAPTSPRSLPAVIGPTENALRALLLRLLAATPLDSYEQWAALNLVDRTPGADQALIGAIGAGLVIDDADARAVLHSLAGTGLLHRVDDTWQVSPTGAGLLSRERRRVAEATGRLVDGIPDTDLVTAVSVLDQVRARAHDERAHLQQ